MTFECSGGIKPRAPSLDKMIIQASLSHSVMARESNVADLWDKPARWEVVLSIVRTEERIRSILAWNSVWRDSRVRVEGGGSSKVWIACSSSSVGRLLTGWVSSGRSNSSDASGS